MCGVCGRFYKHKKHLNRHQRYECIDCGRKPQFVCPYCPYSGKRKAALEAHVMRRHEEILRYENAHLYLSTDNQ